MNKLKKTALILTSTIVIAVVVVIAFISPIAKYLIEKYDEKFTGRQITLDRAYVNPFTGYVYFSNLKIYEFKSDSIFLSVDGISTNFEMLKLFSKTYEISEITLNHPHGLIIQNKKDLNFNDLIEKFSPKKNSGTTKDPIHFNILKIKINDGEFYYQEKQIPINYFIKKVNLESGGKSWNSDTIGIKFSFLSGIGRGDMKGNCSINFKNKDYRLAVLVHKFSLEIIDQYLKDLINYGSFTANLDANVKATGNFTDEENLNASGQIAINDFHFGKTPKEDYASFDKLVLAIIELSPKNHKYILDSVSLNHPYLKYERYDYLDNFQTIFGKKGANVKDITSNPTKFNLIIEIGRYVQIIAKNFFRSNYKVNRLAVYKGDLKFNDFSIGEKFSASLNPLYIVADSIDKKHKRVDVSLKSGLKPYGNIAVTLSIDPQDSVDFDIKYHLQNIPAAVFNPYIISYTSFPLDRGTIDINGKWSVRKGFIQSDNHLVIIDPRVTKKIKNKDNKWIPLPLIMAFIRERGNVIDYEIPITGNLKSPKFHFKDVIFDLIGNIFIKPITTPYRIQVKNVETEIEKSLTLKWPMMHNSLRSNQKKFIEGMADFLVKNPEVIIAVYPQHYETKEKEYILFFEAKKKYFLVVNKRNIQSFCEADSEKVDKMSIKDSCFVHYLNKQTNDPMLFTMQDKCARYVDSTIVNIEFNRLNREREIAFITFFKKKEVEKRVKIYSAVNTIPYNGFSFYKIEYKGDFPESLLEAYQEINQLNDEAPRKKFKKERKQNKNRL
ncbi:MAG TPA: DUF748 domain-containing protein [Bacteroidia bacterium]|jgi:hypothetical protein|nr:DUF748 domain-containing protein [Bacteroidia bacterium]